MIEMDFHLRGETVLKLKTLLLRMSAGWSQWNFLHVNKHIVGSKVVILASKTVFWTIKLFFFYLWLNITLKVYLNFHLNTGDTEYLLC